MKNSTPPYAQLQNSQKVVNFGDSGFDICLVAGDRFFCLKYLFIWQQVLRACQETTFTICRLKSLLRKHFLSQH
jgi:hypothetical protein